MANHNRTPRARSREYENGSKCGKCCKRCCTILCSTIIIFLIICLLHFHKQSKENNVDSDVGTEDSFDDHFNNNNDIAELLAQSDVHRSSLRTSAIEKWTNYVDSNGNYIVPYVISENYHPKIGDRIFKAMKIIEENTCIRFRSRSGEEDFLDIVNRPEEHCFASVGRKPGRNLVNLAWKKVEESPSKKGKVRGRGCVQPFQILHELFHILGLWHEHMRYDHAKHIRIRFDRIPPEKWNLFLPLYSLNMTDTYGLPYDYSSIMHVKKDEQAPAEGIITVETIDPTMQDRIGIFEPNQRVPRNDFFKICAIYKCDRCVGKPFERHITDVEHADRRIPFIGGCPAPLLPKECPYEPGQNEFLANCCQPPEYEKLALILSETEDCIPDHHCKSAQIEPGSEEYNTLCCGGCEHCRPIGQCLWSWRVLFPLKYKFDCCGRCGGKWRRKWCERLAGDEKIDWENAGICF